MAKSTITNNIMLDIETTGNGSTANIIQISAVQFDREGNTYSEFNVLVDRQSGLDLGLVEDQATLDWWNRQSDEAKAIVFDTSIPRVPIKEALESYINWIRGLDINLNSATEWGNGCGFDCVIIANAMKLAGLTSPIKFWNQRDVRTIADISKSSLDLDIKKSMDFSGVAHNAIDDCKHQIKYVTATLKKIHTQFLIVARLKELEEGNESK